MSRRTAGLADRLRFLRSALRGALPGRANGDAAGVRGRRLGSFDWPPGLGDGALAHCVWLGQSTVLLRIAGLTIVTDPVLSETIGVRLGPWTIGPRRLAPAPIAPGGLPPIDLVLISHAHYDHLDRPTLRAIASPGVRVLTATRTRSLIPRGFADVEELAWGATVRIGSLAVTAMRPSHWGARTIWDRRRGFNSYVLGADDGPRILYAADTALTDAFDTLAGTPIDLAIFGVDAYDPWIHAHASPEQIWAMFRATGAGRLLPVHHSTFKLGNEPIDEPLRRLRAAAGDQADRIVAPRPGEAFALPVRGAVLPERGARG